MYNFYNEFFKVLLEDKKVLERLIEIDNKVMGVNLTFEDYYQKLKSITKKEFIPWNIKEKILFITEGSPLITFEILNHLVNNNQECILFINQGFIGVNKWLVDRMISISGESIKLILDTDINYNKYINRKDIKIIPLGEDNLFKCVMEDFKNE